jgi:hypothetical protein
VTGQAGERVVKNAEKEKGERGKKEKCRLTPGQGGLICPRSGDDVTASPRKEM